MKGCARALLLQFVGYLAALAAVAFYLRERTGVGLPKTLGISLIAALFVWLAVAFLVGIAKPVAERAALRDCLSGKRPADGERASIAGTIDAVSSREMLRAPLTGTPCLGYRYEIFEMVRSGKNSTRRVYFEGVALIPSVITAPSGSFRLMAVPTFDFSADAIEPGQATFHWAEYVKTATFDAGFSEKRLEKEWTDDDGRYRWERELPMGEAVLETCQFRETLIRPGEKFYAVGRFSEPRGGIVPDSNWANTTRVMQGDGEAVLRRLRRRAIGYAIGGVLCGGAAFGILAAYIANASR